MRIYEHTKATSVDKDGRGVAVVTPLGTIRCAQAVLGTNADKPLLKRISQYMVPVYDYCLVTEPLSSEQLDRIGWANRQGLSDITNQFHYYRLTSDNRILWGGYDAIYFWGSKVSTEQESRPETWAKLSAHFFETFPQLDDVNFTHTWGGAIDTSTRFSVFFGSALSNRVVYAVGYTGLGVAATRFAASTMLDLLAGRKSIATKTDFVQGEAVAVPARTVPVHRHPGHPLVARPRGQDRQAQRLAAHPRSHGPRLRLVVRATWRARRSSGARR